MCLKDVNTCTYMHIYVNIIYIYTYMYKYTYMGPHYEYSIVFYIICHAVTRYVTVCVCEYMYIYVCMYICVNKQKPWMFQLTCSPCTKQNGQVRVFSLLVQTRCVRFARKTRRVDIYIYIYLFSHTYIGRYLKTYVYLVYAFRRM